MDFWQIIMTPFSWLLKIFCQLFDSYGLALILFTIVVKIILFPLSLKGKKSMIKMNMISGQVKEIQKRCGTDRERYNREVQKLYADNHVSPTGGCGWSMIPLVILMPLYAIIRRPMKYMMSLTESATSAIAGALGWSGEFSVAGYNELTLASMMNSGNLATASAAAGAGATLFVINFQFFGLDLAQIPNWKFWEGGITWGSLGLFLMPIVSAALSVLSMIVSQKTNQMSAGSASAGGANKGMMFISPLISLWIGFTLPAGLCVYWIANSALMMVQEVLCGKILKKDYEAARKEMEEQARLAKEEEKERRRLAAERKAAALAAGKNKKAAAAQPKKGVDTSASRSGLRSYARGRAYDPNRYPVTPYRDPSEKNKQPDPDLEPLTDEEKALLAENGTPIPQEPIQEQDTAPEQETAAPVEEFAPEEEPSEESGDEGDYEPEYSPEDEPDGESKE